MYLVTYDYVDNTFNVNTYKFVCLNVICKQENHNYLLENKSTSFQ